MKLPGGLTASEIRVLQEFRRVGVATMPVAEIRSIRHPSKVGDEVVDALVRKGFLVCTVEDGAFRLTDHGVEFLAQSPAPEFEGTES